MIEGKAERPGRHGTSKSASFLPLQPVIREKDAFFPLMNDALEGGKRDLRETLLQTLLVRLC